MWAEAEEVYLPDAAGRLYRWDIAHETAHSGDSGDVWTGKALPVATFHACQGAGEYNCSIHPANKGDPFYYRPAVVSANRIDELSGAPSGVLDASYRDSFIIALNSGTLFENALYGDDADLHASLYVLADDHRSDTHGGFSIPSGTPKMADDQHPGYWRQAISDFSRIRRYRPFAESDWYEETRKFSRRAVPVRAPRISVERGYETDADGNFTDWIDGTEFIYIEFTVFEGASGECSKEWFDTDAGEWVYDEGATYVIRGRYVARDGDAFNFLQGSGADGDMSSDRYGLDRNGLQFLAAEQVLTGDCDDGNCSPARGARSSPPCDPNSKPAAVTRPTSVRLGFQQLSGFSPVEIRL